MTMITMIVRMIIWQCQFGLGKLRAAAIGQRPVSNEKQQNILFETEASYEMKSKSLYSFLNLFRF